MPMISCHVFMENPDTHIFRIEMHIPALERNTITLSLPVWTPGSYLVREYARNINYLKAHINGTQVATLKSGKNSWTIATNGEPVVVEYDLYAYEESVRTCWLDAEHASIIPAGMFLHIEEVHTSFQIEFHPHPAFTKIDSALAAVGENIWKRYAADADELYDCPIEIGNHATFHFNAQNIPHTLTITGSGNYDPARIIADCKRIIDTEVRIFGHHPCPSYLIILNTSNTLRGGLEHKDSTSLIFKRLMFAPRENYLEFISLFAHEYFHLWNVKRLRPAALGPFNYYAENYTTSLWIAEGFTSYYDDLIVYRAGLYTEDEYLNVFEKNINQAENAPGKHIQSVAEASYDAWIKYYRQNENTENSHVNYYVRGSVLAAILDLLIIHHSGAQYCLDDVMRAAYHKFYINENRGYTEAEFKQILEHYAGISLDHFYENHVNGTKQLSLEAYVNLAGLTLKNTLEGSLESDLGIMITERQVISSVRRNSAGEKGGLYVQDEVIAINGYRWNAGLLSSILHNAKAGDALEFTIARAGLLLNKTVTLQETDKVNYHIEKLPHQTAEQQRNFMKWLAKTPDA